jgi:hypothetical protein
MLAAAGVAMAIVAWRWRRAADATHERVGADAFLGAEETDGHALVDAPIELATHRSPRNDTSPLPPSPLFSDGLSARAAALPTTHRGA